MANFTPGPWTTVEIAEGLFHIHSPKGDRHNPVPVAIVDHHRDGHEPTRTVQTPADANLIAAAPELYEALDEVREYFYDRSDINENGGPNKAMRLVEQIDAALAKADGKVAR